MNQHVFDNIKQTSPWVRGLYMLLFIFIYAIAEVVLGAVVFIQFGFTIFTNKTNQALKDFGAQLSVFIYDIFRYLTYNTEDKPFPFKSWPETPEDTESQLAEHIDQ
ncbi:MAG: DUF4389 domain-containing protein [Gammaproteobacteria bacterium]|nr:DUF4389 domain-containing protein [Gammaproteobacteria bacterium]MDH5730348.1 DUF4389 domain-containing protein [Gammaproteobacteria bacterium]